MTRERPEHYAEAERLLRGNYVPIGVRGAEEPTAYDGKPSERAVAQAHVHATLALAAATVNAAGWSHEVRNETAWTAVTQS